MYWNRKLERRRGAFLSLLVVALRFVALGGTCGSPAGCDSAFDGVGAYLRRDVRPEIESDFLGMEAECDGMRLAGDWGQPFGCMSSGRLGCILERIAENMTSGAEAEEARRLLCNIVPAVVRVDGLGDRSGQDGWRRGTAVLEVLSTARAWRVQDALSSELYGKFLRGGVREDYLGCARSCMATKVRLVPPPTESGDASEDCAPQEDSGYSVFADGPVSADVAAELGRAVREDGVAAVFPSLLRPAVLDAIRSPAVPYCDLTRDPADSDACRTGRDAVLKPGSGNGRRAWWVAGQRVPALYDVALDPSILAVAQEVLQCPPVLSALPLYISVGDSVSEVGEAAAAEMAHTSRTNFHVFHQDLMHVARAVKVFIYVDAVTEESGGAHRYFPRSVDLPWVYTDRDDMMSNRTGNIKMDYLAAAFPEYARTPEEVIDLLEYVRGPAGTVFVTDTRTVHAGGMPNPGGHRMASFAMYTCGSFTWRRSPVRLLPQFPAPETAAFRTAVAHPSTMESIAGLCRDEELIAAGVMSSSEVPIYDDVVVTGPINILPRAWGLDYQVAKAYSPAHVERMAAWARGEDGASVLAQCSGRARDSWPPPSTVTTCQQYRPSQYYLGPACLSVRSRNAGMKFDRIFGGVTLSQVPILALTVATHSSDFDMEVGFDFVDVQGRTRALRFTVPRSPNEWITLLIDTRTLSNGTDVSNVFPHTEDAVRYNGVTPSISSVNLLLNSPGPLPKRPLFLKCVSLLGVDNAAQLLSQDQSVRWVGSSLS